MIPLKSLLLCWCMLTSLLTSAQFNQPDYKPNMWITDGTVYAIARSGNTVYIGGNFTYIGPKTGNGVPLSTSSGLVQGTPLIVEGDVSTSIPDGNGGWYIGGSFTRVGGVPCSRLAHILANNTLDMNWNPEADGAVLTLVISGNTVYAGGSFTNIGGQARNRIAALDATTGQATNWNPDASNLVNTLAISGNTVYAGGSFTSIGGQARNRIAALDATTGQATNWNPDASGGVSRTWINTLVISGNTVYAGGEFTTIGGQARNNIATLDVTTGLATSWNPNASGGLWESYVLTLVVSGNTVYVGGHFWNIGGQARNYIAALDATTGLATSWNPNANHPVNTLAISGNMVYAGGNFRRIGEQTRNSIAALDATTGLAANWNPNAGGDENSLLTLNGVYTIAISGNTVYAGGKFNSIGGKTRRCIAALDATTGQPTNWNPNANRQVNTLAISGNMVYVGGGFSSIGGQNRNRIASLDATTGQATSWNPDANASVRTLAISGNTVYAGGSFTSIGGQKRNNIAAIDAITGQATNWNPDANCGIRGTWVNTLAIRGNTLYVGGDFTSIGGQKRNNIAAIDVITGQATSWNPDASGGTSETLIKTLVISGNTVYAGGEFTSIGGQKRKNIAALDATTGQATKWNPNANYQVSTLAISGNMVYAGGWFSSIGGQERNYMAALDVKSGLATNWNPYAYSDEHFTRICSLSISGNTVYAGGNFTSIMGQNRRSFAALSTSITSRAKKKKN